MVGEFDQGRPHDFLDRARTDAQQHHALQAFADPERAGGGVGIDIADVLQDVDGAMRGGNGQADRGGKFAQYRRLPSLQE